jgi:hypothetical protein
MLPKWSEIPSEATISTLSNHHILCLLRSPHAWIIAPTTNQERAFGYDASIQSLKLAFIQYKRLSRINKDGSVSVSINPEQHKTLLSKYPKLSTPYVFYAFSMHKTYQSVADDYEKYGAPRFMESMGFLDVHKIPKIPTEVSTLRSVASGKVKAYIGKGQYSSPQPLIRGYQFVSGFQICQFGARAEAVTEATSEFNLDERGLGNNMHCLIWKIGSSTNHGELSISDFGHDPRFGWDDD